MNIINLIDEIIAASINSTLLSIHLSLRARPCGGRSNLNNPSEEDCFVISRTADSSQ